MSTTKPWLKEEETAGRRVPGARELDSKTGISFTSKLRDVITSWTTSDCENLGVLDSDGALYHLQWRADRWTAMALSRVGGLNVKIKDGTQITSWVAGTVGHISAISSDGDLFLWFLNPANQDGWRAVNLNSLISFHVPLDGPLTRAC